jgi:hypothetical protein
MRRKLKSANDNEAPNGLAARLRVWMLRLVVMLGSAAVGSSWYLLRVAS